MSGPLDATRMVADSPLCWIVCTTLGGHGPTVSGKPRKIGGSCSRKGTRWIFWSESHPRVLVCAQHAKGQIPARDEIKRRVRQGGHVWREGKP